MKHGKQELKDAVKKSAESIAKDASPDISKMANGVLSQSKSIKDVLGVSDDSVEGIYSQAYLLYNSGRYKDATEVFRLLIMLNSTEPKYLMGLAACLHMMKEYQNAAASYNLVATIDPNNPIPFFHASDCYFQVGDKLTGAAMLEMAIKRAGAKAEFATLVQKSKITLEALKKDFSKSSGAPSETKKATS